MKADRRAKRYTVAALMLLGAALVIEGAYRRGRRKALEEAAQLADDLAAGVANPYKVYNEAFIHACGVVARAIREAS